jgi:hypothetical protein
MSLLINKKLFQKTLDHLDHPRSKTSVMDQIHDRFKDCLKGQSEDEPKLIFNPIPVPVSTHSETILDSPKFWPYLSKRFTLEYLPFFITLTTPAFYLGAIPHYRFTPKLLSRLMQSATAIEAKLAPAELDLISSTSDELSPWLIEFRRIESRSCVGWEADADGGIEGPIEPLQFVQRMSDIGSNRAWDWGSRFDPKAS